MKQEKGHRIISVGTTSTRTLETIRRDHSEFVEKAVGQISLSIQVLNIKLLMV